MMKKETLIKRMMVMLISAAMLVAGPGTGIFAFAEDNTEEGAGSGAAVQTEETAQTANSDEQTQPANNEQTQAANNDEQTQTGNGEEQAQPANNEQAQPANNDEQAQPANNDEQAQPANNDEQTQPANNDEQAQPANNDEQTQPRQTVSINRNVMAMSAAPAAAVTVASAPVIKVGNAVYASIEDAAAANPNGAAIEICSGEVSFDSDLTAVQYTLSVGSSAALIIGANAALKSQNGTNQLIEVKDGGKLVVNGGSFLNDKGSAAVRVKEGGTAEFHGGTFSATYNVIDVQGHVTTIDGGTFTTPEGNTNNRATAIWVSGKGSIDEISGGTFIGNNKSGAGSGLTLRDEAHIGKISGGSFYGGTSVTFYPDPTGSGFGIRIGANPDADTASVGEISGGTFSGGRCIEVQSKGAVKITGGTAEGVVKDGDMKSLNGIHADCTSNISVEGITIKNVRTGIANYGTISKVDGVSITGVNTGILNQSAIGIISNSVIDANYTGVDLAPYSRTATPGVASVGELKNNTVHVADGTAVNLDPGSIIGEIISGTYTTDLTSSREGVIYNTGTISKISGGVFTSKDNYYTVYNTSGGKIGEISGGTFSSDYASSIIYNSWNSSIDRISGGNFTSPLTSYILRNRGGEIGEISGGDFAGGYAALYNNDGSVGKISGGNFSTSDNGWFGIYNVGEDSSIGAIEIAEGTVSVIRGPYAAIASYNSAELGNVDGYGIYMGGSWGTIYTGGNVPLEKGGSEELDLTKEDVNPGNGRYADNKEVLSGNWQIPAGYHMSASKLHIPEMDDEQVDGSLFHFLAKNNTVIYCGNGSTLEKGTAAGGFRDTTLIFRESDTAKAKVEGNDKDSSFFYSNGGREFLGWNTAADGSGNAYKAGDEIDFSGEEFTGGTDIILYAQWGEVIAETPAEEPAAETPAEKPEAETPAAQPADAAVEETPAAELQTPLVQTSAPAASAVTATAAGTPEGETLEDPEVPLAAPETQKTPDVKGWALLNLIAAMITVVGAAYACIRRREEEDETMGSATMKLGGVIAAVASIATFLMTENLAGTMSLTDNWTVIMLFILGVQAATAVIAEKLEGSKEDQEA